MVDIKLNTDKLKRFAFRIEDVNRRIRIIDDRLNTLYNQVGLLGLHNLIQADLLTGFSWRLRQCQIYINETASDFENTEKYINQFDPSAFEARNAIDIWFDYIRCGRGIWDFDLKKIQSLFRRFPGLGTIGYGAVESALCLMNPEAFKAFWGKENIDIRGELGSVEGKTTLDINYLSYKNKKYDSLVKQNKKSIDSNIPDENWYKTNGTILEADWGGAVEESVFKKKIAADSELAYGSVEAKLLTGEAHADAAIGLYVYEADKNGNIVRKLSPGVSAEVGASVALVQVEADGRIGFGKDNKMLGAYGEGDVKVLSAEGEGRLSLSLNEVYAGVKGEVNLFEISGTAGVSLFGTDIGVSGSLKLGVGAHAEVGYTDRKLKVDIGAAFGVGFDIGFEVDVGGTVDAVCDFATSAWDSVTSAAADTWNGVTGAISDAWNWLFG